MTNLHIKNPAGQPGIYPVARRGKEMKYLSFTIVELGGSLTEHSFDNGDEESSLDFYNGSVRIDAEGPYGSWSAEIEPRASIRDSHPMVYIPAGSRIRLRSGNGSATVTCGGAAGKSGGAPVLVGREAIVANSVGKENWNRTVYTHIADNVDAAHLICGETVNRPGGWSSCPPHKHDRWNPPSEVPMEEIYYFQVEPKQGFAFMRVYTDPSDPDPFDHAYPVEHGDTVLIPRGYHPVVACPGYAVNYTWILAGEGRKYGAWSDDPRHAWIRNS